MNDQVQEVTTLEERIEGRIDKSVTKDLTVSSSGGGVGFENAVQAMEFAKLMAVSGISIPKHLRGNPGACLAIVIQAVEWQMSPFAVANKSYSVNDRLAYESQLIQAVILKRAHIVGRFKVEYDGVGPSRRCRVWAVLKNTKETVDYTSPPIGQIPVKNSPLWKSDPDQQLFYYSGRALCRRHFPDVLLGVYSRDELEERDPEDARDITPPKQSLGDKLDALVSNGSLVSNGTPMKKTRKASAKAGEAAGADPVQAGAASPPDDSQAAPAPNTQTAADPPTAAKSATDTPPPLDVSVAAAPQAMTEAHRAGLRRMHADMGNKMGGNSIQAVFDAFVQGNDLHDGDAAYVAGEKVRLAHVRRIAGEGSPSEADAALAKAVNG